MNALELKNLEKTYPNGVKALHGIDLTIKEGDFFALLGPNGAGKSTAIGIISSLVNKSAGDVTVFDKNLDRDPSGVKSCIGLVPQEFNFGIFEKISHIVLNQAGYYGIAPALARQRAEKYLKQLDLWDKREHQARMLSGGMKRRLMIARALIHEPRLLILDEPTAGVDIEIRRSMWDFLREVNAQGVTIILTTHYLEEAESLCRNIAIIQHGRIIENSSMKALLAKQDVETFILDVALTNTLPVNFPQILASDGYTARLLDEHSFEVAIPKGHGLNKLFAVLTQQGYTVTSMRNKSNRLEELFVELTRKKS